VSWETVVGLEVHLRLATRSKLFCGCANRYGGDPNSLTCPVCLGLPGTLPTLNRRAVELGVRLAVALGARVNPTSIFARKQYVYPDLPRNYQITQMDPPLAEGGALEIGSDGRSIPLERLHLEEDAGRLDHEAPGYSRVDFNRAGTPLLEIVTPPALASGAEAEAFLRELQALARWLDASRARMEEGGMRCDANISLRRPGADVLGARVELKNMNSPRNVRLALEHEAVRMAALLDRGGEVREETRTWVPERRLTAVLRAKEDAPDYRYLPEPDLAPLTVAEVWAERIAAALPESRRRVRRRFTAELGLSDDAAAYLTGSRARAAFFEEAVACGVDAQAAARLLTGEGAALANERGTTVEQMGWSPAHIAELAGMVSSGEVLASHAPMLLAAMADGGRSPRDLAAREGLTVDRDPGRLEAWVDDVLAAHPDQVAAWREGRDAIESWLIGRVIAASGGTADPRDVRKTLAERRNRTD